MIANPTPEQLKQINDYTVLIRSLSSQFMKLMSQANQAVNSWDITVAGLVNTGTMGQTITDSSGLAGISPLTDSDVVTLTSYYQNLITTYYDQPHQQMLVKACGPGNAF